MSFQAKRELLIRVAPRYRAAGSKEKTIILDEFVAATGYARKYAIRLLDQPMPVVVKQIKRPREPRYGSEVQAALAIAWTAANCICAKRLVPFLPELVASLEAHGHLTLTEEVRTQLLAMSPATADRILAALRPADRPRGATTTKAGALLKHQVPVRTFADWNEAQPGFFEVDLVAHCGPSVEGLFLWSLVLTDVATGWTECLALRHRSQDAVIDALERVRPLLPFALLGFDTDNGTEFLNFAVLDYCTREGITFTRGRVAKKNDQCFVEQKNGSIVRQLVGYDRFAGEVAYRQLAELYRAMRLYVNFFQPSMKLVNKQREGSKVQRKYDAAQTPFQRLVGFGILSVERVQHLTQVFHALDPVRLLQQIETLQDALWRHAVREATGSSADANPQPTVQPVRFNLTVCLPGDESGVDDNELRLTPPTGETTSQGQKRKYHRVQKELAPRTWRTREDPFEAVAVELQQWFLDTPERTAQSMLQELQAREPERYPDSLLRTLQRRVRTWRSQVILEFDDRLLREDALLNQTLPTSLRAIPLTGQQTMMEVAVKH
jgi:hypothetical protein